MYLIYPSQIYLSVYICAKVLEFTAGYAFTSFGLGYIDSRYKLCCALHGFELYNKNK